MNYIIRAMVLGTPRLFLDVSEQVFQSLRDLIHGVAS